MYFIGPNELVSDSTFKSGGDDILCNLCSSLVNLPLLHRSLP